jgi:hypothetical protein
VHSKETRQDKIFSKDIKIKTKTIL